MTKGEEQIWEASIREVLSQNKRWDSSNKSERYHVIFDKVKMPPKIVLGRASEIIKIEHPEISIKSVGGGVPTNQFIEKFGFKITEDLIYNKTDSKKFRDYIEKKINHRNLFQDFINFGSSLLLDLEIEVYKVRMSLESKGVLSIIIGMRTVFSYEEAENSAVIGLVVSKSFKSLHQNKYNFYSVYDFKGEPEQQLVRVSINDWSEINQPLLDEFKIQFSLQYNHIKNSKLTQWNVEANTTNNALKYVLFKNENINNFMEKSNDNLVKLIRNSFERIWRCADSNKWYILKEYDLLTFDWLDNSIDYNVINIDSLKSGKRAITPWVKKMKQGDLVFIMGKNQYNGIAIINSEYAFQDNVIDMGNNGLKPSVKVTYIHKLDEAINHTLNTHNNPTTFATIDSYKFGLDRVINMLQTEVPEGYNALKNYLNVENISTDKMRGKLKETPLNQILYGPPGTGKTYQTISKAISIIDPEFFLENHDRRDLLVKKFKELTITNWSDSNGQIAFCTFHQSFTYEDFVEGIKPKVVDDKDIIYEVQKGVFKSLCDRARTATKDSSDFDSVVNTLQISIINDGPITLTTNRGNKFDVNYTGQTTFRIKPHESTAENPQYPASIENIRALYEGAPLTDVYNPSYVKGILEYLYSHYNLSKYQEVKNNDKPYIIIIDEINRGNVASIFGELITLVEPNKRSGSKEELSVMLPYSKKEFTVPNNVYIIGTMNTADRSVEALDSALRRRFNFKEVLPDYKVIEKVLGEKNVWNNTQIKTILKKINQRITRLIDRDHQIGHSYFLRLSGVNEENITTELKSIFSENIIPLLQEYFFNDINKLGLVLGDDFLIDSEEKEEANIWAEFKGGDSSNYNEDVLEVIDANSMSDEQFKIAIQKLVN
ncbi:McrB family protein [Maribacter stanieri]|uniref:McrB family protein n=1 Tax=Maribacter stanieri TaxID=440514 RepID=UPI0024947E90|nr:AAA family ATPase [Maribacter stanieri]